jgi:hypothetical protein
MNSRRTAEYGLRIATVLGVGYLWFLLTFNLSQGPVPIYGMTHGYYVTRWPGFLHRMGPGGEIENPVPVLPHEVEAYRIEAPWLIGRTHISWFAVQMETHVVDYPLASAKEVQEITGLSAGIWGRHTQFRTEIGKLSSGLPSLSHRGTNQVTVPSTHLAARSLTVRNHTVPWDCLHGRDAHDAHGRSRPCY